mmetsp:Transcript_7530/g.28293  ORF Transcript_7530/g.28293 Transcript_7530/m.28293 type:complete len:98 (+) Transcript_7530:1386-1679(+)
MAHQLRTCTGQCTHILLSVKQSRRLPCWPRAAKVESQESASTFEGALRRAITRTNTIRSDNNNIIKRAFGVHHLIIPSEEFFFFYDGSKSLLFVQIL